MKISFLILVMMKSANLLHIKSTLNIDLIRKFHVSYNHYNLVTNTGTNLDLNKAYADGDGVSDSQEITGDSNPLDEIAYQQLPYRFYRYSLIYYLAYR